MISPNRERVNQTAPNRIKIYKPLGTLVIEANAPLRIQESAHKRIFNLVPGLEAVPIITEIPPDARLVCRLRVIPS